MEYLLQEQIDELNGALSKLEALPLESETPESVNNKIADIEGLFKKYGIVKKSGFYTRLTKFFRYARWHFHLKDEAPHLKVADFKKPRGPYKGRGLRINLAHFYFFLLRTYYPPDHQPGDPTIRLTWRFSAGGQIQSLEASTSIGSEPLELLVVEDFGKLGPDWKEAKAKYNKLPDQINIADPNINTYKTPQQYRCLISHGHTMLSELLTYINGAEVGRNPSRGKGKPLHLILQDPPTKWMIENVSKQNPILIPHQEGVFSIHYNKRR